MKKEKIASTFLTAQPKPLNGGRLLLYDAAKQDWHYCHHAAVCVFQDRLYAVWSNGKDDEDQPGQRILYSSTADGECWEKPQILCSAFAGQYGYDTVLTACGFHTYGKQMNIYFSSYEYKTSTRKDRYNPGTPGYGCHNTQLYVMTTEDGKVFSAPQALGIPVCPVCGPRRLSSGRLLMAGSFLHAWTDDPAGLSGWKTGNFCPEGFQLPEPVTDDPTYCRTASITIGLPAVMCEGTFIEDTDGAIHMLYRADMRPDGEDCRCLWQSDSTDGGEHWSMPVRTDFPNGRSKVCIGQLPDGRFYYLGNPGPDLSRCPLVLSLSKDGFVFDTHYLLDTEKTKIKFPGIYKGNSNYAYPHAAVWRDALYIIYSVHKEDIAVQRISLSEL